MFSRVLILFLSLLIVCNDSAYANCPLQVSHLPGNITLIESNYSKFKIEQDWIKQLYPSPMEENPWTFSAITQGVGHIRGVFLNEDNSEQTFSEFYALRRGSETYWYLIVKDRLGWVVAGSAKGEFTCNYIDDPSTIIKKISTTFKSVQPTSSELKINHPSTLYTRLGLD